MRTNIFIMALFLLSSIAVSADGADPGPSVERPADCEIIETTDEFPFVKVRPECAMDGVTTDSK